MKTKFLLLLLPAIFYAQNLKQLIEYADNNNSLVLSKQLEEKSKEQEIESVSSSYYPTLDVGGFYQNLDERTYGVPGETFSAYGKVSFDIYDGGRRSSLKNQKDSEYKASRLNTKAFKKSLSLQLVNSFYNVKNIEASIKALQEQEHSLNAQLKRVKEFFKADLSTKDNIDKLQAAFDTNSYNLQSLKFQKLTTTKDLQLKIGKKIENLQDSSFIKNENINLEINDELKAMNESKKALNALSTSVNSAYYPKLNISDTYSFYNYNGTDSTHPEGLDEQNKLLLTLNIRLFDGNSTDKTSKSIRLNKDALNKQIDYKNEEQQMLFSLSKQRILTNKLKIKSSKSAYISSQSAYITIEEKYKAGIVDNVAFLDALSVKTSAKALFEKSLNDLEVAYATYYYHAGKNIQEFIK